MSQLLKYFNLDVLAEQGVKGFPVSVVVVEDTLDFNEYSKIAGQFESSDTSFVHYSEERNILEVRSFSSNGLEILGYGHNLLGAVHTVLFNQHVFKPNCDEIPEIFIQGRSIPISVHGHDLKFLQKSARIKNEFDLTTIAKTISVLEMELGIGSLKPSIVETECSFLVVPVKSIEVLNRCKPRKQLLQTLSEAHGFEGIYCFSFSEENSDFFVNTRFFNARTGISDNSETLGAAGSLAGFLHFHGRFKENVEYAMLHEEPMERSSVIKCKIEKDFILIGGTAETTREDAIHV